MAVAVPLDWRCFTGNIGANPFSVNVFCAMAGTAETAVGSGRFGYVYSDGKFSRVGG